jgi:soluble lytic murein transglycosylase
MRAHSFVDSMALSIFAPLAVALLGATVPQPPAALGQGVRAFRSGNFADAVVALRRAHTAKLRNDDYARFYLAESLVATGGHAEALTLFRGLSREASSRFSPAAKWRVADVLWETKALAAASSEYHALLKNKVADGQPANAWMRVATFALSQKDEALARTALETISVQFATHPLAADAEKQLHLLSPKIAGAEQQTAVLSPRQRIDRARGLSDRHQWTAAITDLEPLGDGLTPELQALRDFVVGQAKYRSRLDYTGASKLLYGAVAHLPEKEAIWAAFHGARALSRADRDEEAITGYLRFVATYPKSTFAPEAQFLAGWLSFNQGRFADAIPGLKETMRRFGHTTFAVDSAWYVAMSAYFKGDLSQALEALTAFEKVAQDGRKQRMWPSDRVKYWRARILSQLSRSEESKQLYEALATEQPLRWYGLLATARLREQKLADPIQLPNGSAPLAPIDANALKDPAVLRVDELLAAQLPSDAGFEIERASNSIMKRLGKTRGLAVVIDRSNAAGVWAKSYRLADVYGSGALAYKPQGDVRVVWQAVYPLAYPELVNKYGPAAGNPEHYLNSIMHKESGFDPSVISYADARGLLQMIPPTSRKVAQMLGAPYQDDELLQPEFNVRLGSVYIGALFKKFHQQIQAAAGAYNAGPGSMVRWLERHGKHPMDEFVELVPYEQTREYMKRVTSIYARYRYLYAGERYLPPLTVDATYQKEEPNY